MDKKTITIVGAYNIDLSMKCRRLPVLGETVTADRFKEGAGGKGSNQAVTAALFGADIKFVARVGSDSYGRYGLDLYKKVGISTEFITVDKTVHSGIGIILIDKDGKNMISVAPGANLKLSREDIDHAGHVIENSTLAGFQFENDLDTVLYGLRMAHKKGVLTFLDPAPAKNIPEDAYQYIDIIKPNETEASMITGIKVDNITSAESAGRWLVKRGVKTAIVTLGERGAVLVDGNTSRHFPAPSVKAIDSTGAGDIFSGVFMAALTSGKAMPEAIEYATAAAALSTTRLGVIDSIPSPEEVDSFILKLERNKQ
ncbi:MAG: ribokinase [Chloroflexi bacterium]|nr:ribokinase [Chloroflexota bacterium]